MGFRVVEPLKMTSAIDSPRNVFAEDSPMTHRTASMIFDLPHPLGPTTAHKLVGNGTVVGSTNDLKPASLIACKRIYLSYSRCFLLSSDCLPSKRPGYQHRGDTSGGRVVKFAKPFYYSFGTYALFYCTGRRIPTHALRKHQTNLKTICIVRL